LRRYSIFLFLVLVLSGCKSSHQLGQLLDLREGGERTTQHRFTGTRHIDSVDVKTLTVDVWKVEHYAYPDSIRLFVRVLDTTGFVVTHMADPYKKAGAPNYFPTLVEQLGSKRRVKQAPVTEFKVREYGEQDSIPTSIALAIDYSGSMKGVKSSIDQGIELFVGMKRKCDFISLTAFHKTIKTVFPLMTDTVAMLAEFREFKKTAQGLFTSSIDGIMQSLTTLEKVSIEQPKVCIVFADGDENTSKAKMSDLFEYAVKHNISIYCIGFAYAQDEPLQNLALYTGGKYYRAYTKADLISIFLDIYRSLQNYYLVTYVPPRYDGLHLANVIVRVPGRDDMTATGTYDKTPLNPLSPTDEFSRLILFAYNKSEIDSASAPIIDELADALERFDRVIIEIQGHTDNVGGEEFNQILSEARANSVRNALIAKGIEPERMRSRGFGFTVPIAPNDTDQNRARNRRTVFKILRK